MQSTYIQNTFYKRIEYSHAIAQALLIEFDWAAVHQLEVCSGPGLARGLYPAGTWDLFFCRGPVRHMSVDFSNWEAHDR